MRNGLILQHILCFILFILFFNMPVALSGTNKTPKERLQEKGIEFTHARFIEAVELDELDIVKMFINAGINVNKSGDALKTPLIIAAENQNDEIMQLLVQAGASVNRYDALGHTALMLACENGDISAVELLLEHGADINAENDQCESPLGNAIRAKKEKIVNMLLASGADVSAMLNNSACASNAPLFLSAMFGTKPIVEMLIENGAKIDTQNYYGETALISLSKRTDRGGMAEILLNNGADPKIKDVKGKTALDYARENKNGSIESRILEALKIR